MSIELLELQRARKALERFCHERNCATISAGRALGCEQQGDDLVLTETCAPAVIGGSAVARPFVRLQFREGKWLLYWRTRGDGWGPWPHLPRADSVQRIIDELEQAPLHVHWG